MKTIITILLLFFACSFSNAQIFGSNDVCAGYAYSYTASIPGAVTYSWSFPPGWYDLSGQGTGSVTATCNVNTGDIYCEGIDSGGNSITTLVLVTQFGGGVAVGWDVQPQNSTTCVGDPYSLNIVPNGSGGGSCPNGCGSGSPILNIAFAVYDNVWPSGNFVGFADGSGLPVPAVPGSYTYYIYNIDYTNGTSTAQAVLIEGACGTATVNNIAQLNIPIPIGPGFSQLPDPVCIGDTVSVWELTGGTNGGYTPIMGITILNQSGGSMVAVVNSMPARAQYSGLDFNGCPVSETCYINLTTCAPAFLTGDSVVCNGINYTYMVYIPGAISYTWLIPLAWTNLTGQGTATITATCNGGNDWITVWGYDSLGNIVGAKDIFTQIGSPSFCNGGSINGDTILCAGYVYNYTASISGAVSYTWTFPAGWYDITGQGTANISATCNINVGNICVEGFDAVGNSLGTECLLTEFGGGGFTGWDVQPSSVSGCNGAPFSLSVVPNGTGGGPGCPPGCGNGTLHPNIVYGIYSGVWPTSFYYGNADGVTSFILGGFGQPSGIVYVYLVDITNGVDPPQAIRIEGGCGSGVVNNTCNISPLIPNPPVVSQMPMPACIGDTIQLLEVTGLTNVGWGFIGGNDLSFVSGQFSNPLIAVVTGNNPYTDVTGIDANGCLTYLPMVGVSLGICAAPSAQFASSDTVFCDKQSINFTDLSTNNPTSWQWSFPGATPSASTDQNPQGIYYPTNGLFDVTLIACNAAGCDTITINNFIVEYLAPSDSIFELNDTLFSFPAITYQWYEVITGLISGATNQYYVPFQNGNYYCVITDSVGCSGPSNTIAITTGISTISNFEFPIFIIPNPNNGIFSLELNASSTIKILKTQIINVLGEIIYEKYFENATGKLSQGINLNNQPKGIYVLKLMNDEKIFTQKIIIH